MYYNIILYYYSYMFEINKFFILQLQKLLMTFCAKMIQMKNHPIILTMVNSSLSFTKYW